MQAWHDVYFTSRDGLRLYGRYYAAAAPSSRRPVLCLAGLTRNSRDFHDLAVALTEEGRDVYTLDSRGRGLSERDRDWKNYTVLVELNDALDFMTTKGLTDAAIVGTSRGGLIAMLMAAVRPCALGAVVLNDVGPVIEREGLSRIAAYVGRVPLPASWDEATALVREMSERQFPAVPATQWAEVARAWFNVDKSGLPAPGYDRELSKALSVMDGPLPSLWPQFEALARVPVLAIRGANSDLLSEATLNEMGIRHPRFASLTVPGQGHAPLLKDADSIMAVADFLAQTDDATATSPLPAPVLS
jgi:pimeloyl-ACP methyl ester carboxylesterase